MAADGWGLHLLFNFCLFHKTPPPQEMGCLVQWLTRKMHPAVQRRGALFTTTTGLDPHGVRDALDSVAQTCFFLDKKAGKTNAMRLVLGLFAFVLDRFIPGHDSFPPYEPG